MRERQGCRSVSIEGDLGDVGVRRLFRLRARRMDGCFRTVPGDGSRLPFADASAHLPSQFSVPIWLSRGSDYR